MSSGSSVQVLDLATWCGLAHNLADLLLLVCRESVDHCQCLELGLPGEDGKQRAHALISIFEPLALSHDGESLEGVELAISEGLEEVHAI